MIRYLFILSFFLGIASCNEAPAPAQEEEEEVEEVLELNEDTLSEPSVASEPEEEKMRCIDADILERMGSEGRSESFVKLLKSHGFSLLNTPADREPNTFHYFNRETGKNLIRRFENLREGGYTETIHYECTPRLLACFEESIDRARYALVRGEYRLKGTGSYAYQRFSIDRIQNVVTYTHHVGKELTAPDPMRDSLFPLLPD